MINQSKNQWKLMGFVKKPKCIILLISHKYYGTNKKYGVLLKNIMANYIYTYLKVYKVHLEQFKII